MKRPYMVSWRDSEYDWNQYHAVRFATEQAALHYAEQLLTENIWELYIDYAPVGAYERSERIYKGVLKMERLEKL